MNIFRIYEKYTEIYGCSCKTSHKIVNIRLFFCKTPLLNPIIIKLIAKEVVKELRRTEKPQSELISCKDAAALIGVSEDYIRKIKDRLPHVKQGNNNQGRLLFLRDGLLEAYLNSK